MKTREFVGMILVLGVIFALMVSSYQRSRRVENIVQEAKKQN